MPYLITFMLLAVFVPNTTSFSRPGVVQQRMKVALTPFNLRGMPVTINTAEAKDIVGAYSIEYSITNFGTEQIQEVNFKVLTVDPTGKVIKIKDTFSREKIDVGQTLIGDADVKGTLKPARNLFIAVNKVITASGVWLVQDTALTSAIKTKLNNQTANDPTVTFQSHATTTDDDRIQIFELALRETLRDKQKIELLRNPSKLIMLRESVSFNLPRTLSADVIALNKEEIQALADVEGETVFMIYEPLTSEGSQVFADIVVRRAVPRHPPKIYIASSYVFRFVCAKENGRWVIQDFVGIARSGGLGLP